MTTLTIEQMAEILSALLAQRLRVCGPTLESRVNRASARLPRTVRKAARQRTRSPKAPSCAPNSTLTRLATPITYALPTCAT